MKAIRYAALTACLLILPVLLVQVTPEISNVRKEKRTSERGLYVTAWTTQNHNYFSYLKNLAKKHNLNTLVIDAKEMISRPILELAKSKKLKSDTLAQPSPWLEDLTDKLHKEGFIVTVRLVVFKDDHLILNRPDLGIYLQNGALYRDYKGGRWADPYSEEVRLYNELIAEVAAISGVDEIQFDYIRFPAEGAAIDAVFPHKDKRTRVETINQFLKGAKKRVDKYNTSLAVDIFGVTAWQSKSDIELLGQSLEAMAKYLDVLSPMLYPSHFHDGYDGYANPGSYPYYFVNTGVKKALALLASAEVETELVPWIQGFNLKSPNFGPDYIKEQIRACYDEGIDRFLIWNARNVYDSLPKDMDN